MRRPNHEIDDQPGEAMLAVLRARGLSVAEFRKMQRRAAVEGDASARYELAQINDEVQARAGDST